LQLVGKGRLKSGPLSLGKTPFRGFNHAAFLALERDLRVIRRATLRDFRRMSFNLRLRGPDGKIVFATERLAVPEERVKEVRVLMRVEKISATAAVRRVLLDTIRAGAGRFMELQRGLYYERRGRGITINEYKGMDAFLLREELRRKRRAQGFQWSIELNVEI